MRLMLNWLAIMHFTMQEEYLTMGIRLFYKYDPNKYFLSGWINNLDPCKNFHLGNYGSTKGEADNGHDFELCFHHVKI